MTDQPAGFGPTSAELLATQHKFGVATGQVLRDHLISHVLAALTEIDGLVFFGGTALSRTHLPDLRLSEDIDLIATTSRSQAAERIGQAVARRLARSHGRVDWSPALDRTRGSSPAVLRAAGLAVQIQLLGNTGYPAWPTEISDLKQRYSDAPPARLRTLTAPAFVAAKTAAWAERGSSRDLFDLWGLAQAGHISTDALNLYRTLGPTGHQPSAALFDSLPTTTQWNVELSHQCRLEVDPATAAAVVTEAWAAVG